MLELQLQKAQALDAGSGSSVERSERSVRCKLLRAAELVCCTLSAAGGDLTNLARGRPGRGGGGGRGGGFSGNEPLFFDAVIIDEAAQAIEPAALIPLYHLNKGRVRCPVLMCFEIQVCRNEPDSLGGQRVSGL